MDEIVKKFAGLGVPGLFLLVAMSAASASGLVGAAVITSALAALGPFGILGGVATLGVIGLSADKIAEIGYEKVTVLVVKEQLKTTSKQDMIKKVNKYPVSSGMKLKIIDFIEKA
ncbi:MAG: hypothetical protein SOV02_05090 [Streptococcus infantarius]|nr:hypothetical protein [Streptococcus infantarius]